MDKNLPRRPISGTIAAIPSKSQAHRLLICAALSDAPTRILCNGTSKDIEATIGCLNGLGADITRDGETITVRPIQAPAEAPVIDCGESGSTLRFLLPVAAALGNRTTFRLHGRLADRPLSPLREELEAHGCRLSRPTPDTLLVEGRLTGGDFAMAGNISSQFFSGLLFALPLVGASRIHLTTPMESAAYLEMTRSALAQFGVRSPASEDGWCIPGGQHFHGPEQTVVEGDWSNAAFWLCAGAISRPVTVTGLDLASGQGDRAILSVLEQFGAKVDGTTVSPAPLHGIDLNVSEIPDLVPPIALVACCAEGTTRITGAARLRLKESDRLMTVAETLNRLGGRVEIEADGLTIHGTALTGGEVDSFNDHRIAMMSAIAATQCPVLLHGAQAVEKSYPQFWADLESRCQP